MEAQLDGARQVGSRCVTGYSTKWAGVEPFTKRGSQDAVSVKQLLYDWCRIMCMTGCRKTYQPSCGL
jgi:hypothetical protein